MVPLEFRSHFHVMQVEVGCLCQALEVMYAAMRRHVASIVVSINGRQARFPSVWLGHRAGHEMAVTKTDAARPPAYRHPYKRLRTIFPVFIKLFYADHAESEFDGKANRDLRLMPVRTVTAFERREDTASLSIVNVACSNTSTRTTGS